MNRAACKICILLLLTPLYVYTQNPVRNDSAKIYIHDTIHRVVFDTVKVYDTVFEYEYEYVTLPDTQPVMEQDKQAFVFSFGVLPEKLSTPLSYQISSQFEQKVSEKVSFRIGFGAFFKQQSASYNSKAFTSSRQVHTGHWRTDTVDYFYQLYKLDTIWIPVTRDVWITDSTMVTITDTLHMRKALNQTSRYAFFEIPASVHYTIWSTRKLRINASAGVNAGLLFYRNEYYLTGDEWEYVHAEKVSGIRPSLRLTAGVEALVPVTGKVSVAFCPGYSYMALRPFPTVYSRHQLFANVSLRIRI